MSTPPRAQNDRKAVNKENLDNNEDNQMKQP